MPERKDRFGDAPRVPPEQWYQGPMSSGGGSGSSSSGTGCWLTMVTFVLGVLALLVVL